MELPKELKTIYDGLTESEKENYRKNFDPILRGKLEKHKLKFEFGNPDIEDFKDSLFEPIANLNLKAKDVANWRSFEYKQLIALNDYCELIKSFNEAKEEVLDEITDYSDTAKNEKIVFLYKLGVVDFLRENPLFASSTNKLAKYLSAITGEKAGTLQSYLNPIISRDANQRNNPLINEDLVEEVELKLINMGLTKEDLKN